MEIEKSVKWNMSSYTELPWVSDKLWDLFIVSIYIMCSVSVEYSPDSLSTLLWCKCLFSILL